MPHQQHDENGDDDGNLVGVFALRVAEEPGRIAVTFLGDNTSYAQLDELSDRVATFLLTDGLRAEEPVGFFMDRGVGAIATVVGIVKAGGAHVGLDTGSPASRLGLIVQECGITRVVVDSSERIAAVREFGGPGVEVVVFGDLPAGDQHTVRPALRIAPQRLAYVIYTSGSTGTPKGVCVSHCDLLAFTRDPCWGDGVDRSVLHHSPLNFDPSVFEVWMPLLRGGRVVVAPSDTVDAHRLGRLVTEEKVTAAFVTTSHFNVLVEEYPDVFAGMRQVWMGGEPASPTVVQQALRAGGPGSVVNVYGPTEATIFATYHVVPESLGGPGGPVPIGRPMAGVRVYVLDECLRPVEPGRTGELCLAGRGVARGYRNRPALTAERFVPDPFAGDGSRMYRTGDLVRETGDGLLEFVGRRDRQVKVRGFRVELGEIENRLAQRTDVSAVAVVAREDRQGDKALHAYLVPHGPHSPSRHGAARTAGGDLAPGEDDGGRAWAREVRRDLHGNLPAYMVPVTFTVLDRLPLTPNGKLDARALPVPSREGIGGQPASASEERLCRIFAEVLGLEAVGADDHVFEQGGHSLLAVRVIARIESAVGVRLGVDDLLDQPTARKLAKRLEAAAPAEAGPAVTLTAHPHTGPVPLSAAQRRLWFLNRMGANSAPAYHIPVVYRLRAGADPAVLRAALADVTARHESLRTVFPLDDGEPWQRVLGPGEWELNLPVVACAPDALEGCLVAATREPFDLEHDLPVRAVLFRAGQETVLLVVLHHIGADGWSLAILTRDLGTAWAAQAAGQAPGLAPLPLQYRDYTLWQRAAAATEEHLRYWRTRLAGIPDELPLPADRPRPVVASHGGDVLDFEVPADLRHDLEELARGSRTSLFVVLQAGLACLLTRLGAGEDVVVGSPIAGREHSALDDLIGFFVNTVVLRTDTSGNPGFRELVDRVRAGWHAAYSHQDVPFETLVEELNPPRSLGRHPLFQVSLGLLNTPDLVRSIDGRSGPWRLGNTGSAKFDLAFTLIPRGADEGGPGGLEGTVEYATDLFDADTVRRIVARLLLLLRQAADHPDRSIGRLRITTEQERQSLLAAAAVRPDGRTVVQHFRARAQEHPGRTAVVDGGIRWTYRRLDERSDAVARFLALRSVAPETPVALLTDRGADVVAALLGTLKAGAVYVPLDARFPPARVQTMLADCGVRVVLVDTPERRDAVRAFAGEDTEVVLLDTAVREGGGRVGGPAPQEPVGPDQLAYILYTSGSTGTPKGVGVTHADIVHLVADSRWSDADVSRVLLYSPLAFDASTFEVWAPLLRGGTAVIAPAGEDNVAALREALTTADISMVLMTTALFNLLVQEDPAVFARVGKVSVGGEAASPAAFARALEISAPGTIVHAYGPTETTTFSVCQVVERVDGTTVPLGGPMDGVRAYVLDPYGEPADFGVPGELCLAGGGMARGYVGRPALTAERFVPDPFGPPGSRMYRTGDLFRRRADKRLEFVGRIDRQVKIRGFRIEPSEIEAALTELPEVGQAAVAAREDPALGRILIAYAVPASGAADDPDGLRERLRSAVEARLPAYMMPSAFVLLPDLPMTANHKIDWQALPAPVLDAGSRQPRTPEERVLCALFAEILGRDTVGADDDFFERGGHSLLAVRLLGRIRADHGVDVSVQTLFTSPTPAGLAAALVDGDRLRLSPAVGGRSPKAAR